MSGEDWPAPAEEEDGVCSCVLAVWVCSFAQHSTSLFADFQGGDPFSSLSLIPQFELYLNTANVFIAMTFLFPVQSLRSPRTAPHIPAEASVKELGAWSPGPATGFFFNLSYLGKGFRDRVALVENFGIILNFTSSFL